MYRFHDPTIFRKFIISKRNSEYIRRDLDFYETPTWVTQALVPHLPNSVMSIWEPAAGSGKIVSALDTMGFDVVGTDLTTNVDFLREDIYPTHRWIITNPPFKLAREFIERSLELTKAAKTGLAMLLPIDYDSAKTRRHLFNDHPAFAKKIVLLKRIRWIEGSTGSPSENHCWLIWDWQQKGPPIIGYAPL